MAFRALIILAIPFPAPKPKPWFWLLKLAPDCVPSDAPICCSQRIQAFEQQMAETKKRRETQEQALQQAKERLSEAEKLEERQAELANQEKSTRSDTQGTPNQPVGSTRKRTKPQPTAYTAARKPGRQRKNDWRRPTARWKQQMDELAALDQRLKRFEQENATTLSQSQPISAWMQVLAPTRTWHCLIEMGYEVYTKPHGHQVLAYLKKQVNDQTTWIRVGANAELVAWPDLPLTKCPYPLDVALERFYTGKTLKHSALFHFGADPVTEDLPAWFRTIQWQADHRSWDQRRQTGLLSAPYQSPL